ncbi:LuxE/PaaK family acyltransferase [Symbiobacterium terraclitae]|uniref:LuxE/PaaK family acyltransferase n=1 Tax=Symbiobacterium terraclitae TaxID=557451 RepID=UPI0035B54034
MTATWSDPLAAQLLSIFSGAPFAFSELALTLFARQYERCAPYRRYCDARGKTPETVTDWREIPHLPVTAFKHARIYSGEGQPAHYFETSGTTQGAERRGRHYFERLDLYRACSRPVFRRFVLPDLPDGARMPMLMLAQSPAENPRSSLSWYLSQQAEAFAAEFDWYVDSHGLRLSALEAALRQAEGPVALLGTAFAFVHLVDSGLRVQLPPGSRVMETGGFKGKSREVSRDELYRLIRQALGPDVICINQYGMCEMSSNGYDQTLVSGSPRKAVPEWVRIRMLDPETLAEVPPGQPGMVAVTDLANLYSCAFLLTQDIGVQYPDGFEILGRAPGAEARGCSIAMDEFLRANQQSSGGDGA